VGLGMDNVGLFYDRLVYYTAIWYILWPVGIFYGHLLYYIFLFWYVVPKDNLATPRLKRPMFLEVRFFQKFLRLMQYQ
jgi:hypothetical protein